MRSLLHLSCWRVSSLASALLSGLFRKVYRRKEKSTTATTTTTTTTEQEETKKTRWNWWNDLTDGSRLTESDWLADAPVCAHGGNRIEEWADAWNPARIIKTGARALVHASSTDDTPKLLLDPNATSASSLKGLCIHWLVRSTCVCVCVLRIRPIRRLDSSQLKGTVFPFLSSDVLVSLSLSLSLALLFPFSIFLFYSSRLLFISSLFFVIYFFRLLLLGFSVFFNETFVWYGRPLRPIDNRLAVVGTVSVLQLWSDGRR